MSAVQGQAPPARGVPRGDLVNVLEYETQAALRLLPPAYARVAGSDRAVFDRITLHPRMMVPTRGLDLSLSLFGQSHFAPIIVGPLSGLGEIDPAGEGAVVEGASAANATVVLAHAAGQPIDALVARARTPVWWQVFASDGDAPAAARRAVSAGCRVVVVTVGAAPASGGVRAAGVGTREWRTVRAITAAAGVPVVVKGITNPIGARQAAASGAAGIVFSNYGGLVRSRETASILDLPAILEAVDGRLPVFADGGFRRGTDILKALAFGASAVLVARPVAWGLAAYGTPGVQGVLEMLQTELARYMAMCGRPDLRAVDRTVVRVHS